MNGWERENNSSITEEKEDCAQYMWCIMIWRIFFYEIKILNCEKAHYGESRFSCNFRPNTKDHYIIKVNPLGDHRY